MCVSGASEVTLKNMGTIDWQQNTTTHDNPRNVYTFRGTTVYKRTCVPEAGIKGRDK